MIKHTCKPYLTVRGDTYKPGAGTIGWNFKNTGNSRATIRNTAIGGDAWILLPGESMDTRNNGTLDRGTYEIIFTDQGQEQLLVNEVNVTEFLIVNTEH